MKLHVIERPASRDTTRTDTSRATASGAHDAGPVVFLHGLFGKARNLGFLQRAASAHFDTLALDLRNHGQSPHGPANYTSMAHDVLETLDSLGVGRFMIVGHSMGGKVAMMLALLAPERVSKLLVADMAPTRTDHGHKAMVSRLARTPFPPSLDRHTGLDFLEPLVGGRAVAELMLQNVALGENPAWAIGFSDLARDISQIEDWPEPTVQPYGGPVLFLRGGDSPYVTDAHEPRIRTLFPDARIHTLPGAGHWLHAEQPKAFVAEMMAFLLENT